MSGQVGASGSLRLLGVNLSGAEYGKVSAADRIGVTHFYPSDAAIDLYAANGMNVIRLPFKWERLQTQQFGALSATELAEIDRIVSYAVSKGMTVILDPHNFGSGYGQMIGSAGTPTAAFVDLWARVADHFRTAPNVVFGLMNEPSVQSPQDWLTIANAAIAAIRATGAEQQILVPGSKWSGAQTWVTSGNAAVIGGGVVDPAGNHAFEVHLYLDSNGSGTNSAVLSPMVGVDRMASATEWARINGAKLFLGEIGVGSDPASLAALHNVLSYMTANADVWQGMTYWDGGERASAHVFYSIFPHGGIEKAQTGLLNDFVPRAGEPSYEGASDGLSLASTRSVSLAPAQKSLFLSGYADASGAGNDLANQIIGNMGHNMLTGGAGDDVLDGWLGNDRLEGGTGRDRLVGGLGNDTLDGGMGVDTLEGGQGDDVFLVDDLGDVVAGETRASGIDHVFSSVSFTLSEPLERLTLLRGGLTATGSRLSNKLEGSAGNDRLRGMDGHDVLWGGAGHDELDGGSGADTMEGGLGDDVYWVGNVGDRVTEALAGGYDTVRASISYTLGAHLERLVLTGSMLVGRGNELNNLIEGSSGADTLYGMAGDDTLVGGGGNDVFDGGTGVDLMAGGSGDDTYRADDAGDLVVELPGGGADRILSSASFVIAAGVERLILTAAGRTATGDGTGNILEGSAGSDTLMGMGGVDTLYGNAGNDRLDGGAGADAMSGGLGDDVYIVDDAGDRCHEAVGAGVDHVITSVSHTLGLEIENLTLLVAGLTGTGNDRSNILTGSVGDDRLFGGNGDDKLIGGGGNDRLDGGAGGDTMEGGAGDDIYVVSSTADVVVEAADSGIDWVQSRVTITLGAEVEKLTLLSSYLTGTGNSMANTIEGSSGSDTLLGMAGNDTLFGFAGADRLEGGAGDDVLTGGEGDDIFIFRKGDVGGADTITDFSIVGAEQIRILGYLDMDSFAEVRSAFIQMGSDTVIPLGDGASIRLAGVAAASLTISDFWFG